MTKLKVALIQDAPVLFDLALSLEKLEKLSVKAAKTGAKLILFPEAFLGGYPRGLSFGTVVGSRKPEGREDWFAYWNACPSITPQFEERIGGLAARLGVYIGIGIIEKSGTGGSLYCSFVVFDPEGRLIHHHRKIKPTGTERLIWGEGNGQSLRTFDTEYGKMGSLICWENYMPLARMALYEGGMGIHLAPTADSRDSWQASMVHIALEGRCFVLSVNQFVSKDMYPEKYQSELKDQASIMSRGGSVIISPLGEILAGPLFDKAGIVSAELDLDLIVKSRLDFDAVGHYSRPDIFQFSLRDKLNK